MNICIFGLWHLGSVTAACVAEHFPTVGLSSCDATVEKLQAGEPPIFEPGLAELVKAGIASQRLRFTTDLAAVAEAGIVWVTFDTPVNENDEADVDYVERQVASLFPLLRDGCIVLISSQIAAGSTRRMETAFRKERPGAKVSFAYSPENLRLGKALDAFRHPARIVIGVREDSDREPLQSLLSPFCKNLLWVSVESAEMTKHALNAFLATSVAFINEIAALCEHTGADAKEVESGLKSDDRIGPKAYLAAGGPFSGGTLARDISFLNQLGRESHLPVPLLESVRTSNDLHKEWVRRRLSAALGSIKGKNIAILGLTYKAGTDTLRRSASIELCEWLLQSGAGIRAFDPAVKELPPELKGIQLANSLTEAIQAADAIVVATEWPEFRQLLLEDVLATKARLVIDANGFLQNVFAQCPSVQYWRVGRVSTFA
ncbi:MAG: nucleotide sugar dehydrogenase [Bryobacteraceae bacterium]